MNKQLVKSMAAVAFGFALLSIGQLLTGEFTLGEEIGSTSIETVAVPLGVIALLIAFATVDRPIDKLESDGWIAIGIAVLAHVGVFLDVEFIETTLLSSYHPWTGIAVALIGYYGYWALAFGDGGLFDG